MQTIYKHMGRFGTKFWLLSSIKILSLNRIRSFKFKKASLVPTIFCSPSFFEDLLHEWEKQKQLLIHSTSTHLACLLQGIRSQATGQVRGSFWYGEFQIPCNETEAKDTFLRLPGWSKGLAFINQFNLGKTFNDIQTNDSWCLLLSQLLHRVDKSDRIDLVTTQLCHDIWP